MAEEYRCRGVIHINPAELQMLSGISVCDSRFQPDANPPGTAPTVEETWETPSPYLAANRFHNDTIPSLDLIDATNNSGSDVVYTFGIPSAVRSDLGMVGFDVSSYSPDGTLDHSIVLRILSHDPAALPAKSYRAIEWRASSLSTPGWDIYSVIYDNDVLVSETPIAVGFFGSNAVQFSPILDIATGDVLVNVYSDGDDVDRGVLSVIENFFDSAWPITICGELTLHSGAGNLAFNMTIDPATVPETEGYNIKPWLHTPVIFNYVMDAPPVWFIPGTSTAVVTPDPPASPVIGQGPQTITGDAATIIDHYDNVVIPAMATYYTNNVEGYTGTVDDGAGTVYGTVDYSDAGLPVITLLDFPEAPGPVTLSTPYTSMAEALAEFSADGSQWDAMEVSFAVPVATTVDGTVSEENGVVIVGDGADNVVEFYPYSHYIDRA